jgi:hypothetical protein
MMADGGWRMADGGWRMADGGWLIVSMLCLFACLLVNVKDSPLSSMAQNAQLEKHVIPRVLLVQSYSTTFVT